MSKLQMAIDMHAVQLARANRLEAEVIRLERYVAAVKKAINDLPHDDWCCGTGCQNLYHRQCPGCECYVGSIKTVIRAAETGGLNV